MIAWTILSRRKNIALRLSTPPVDRGGLYQRMRSTPTRQAEVLDGGSIYWAIKGYLRARQRILGIETRMDSEGRKRCFLHLDPEVIPTVLSPSKPRRGWRYLDVKEAPPDQTEAASGNGVHHWPA